MAKKNSGFDSRYTILKTIRKSGGMSKAELAKKLKMSKPAIAEHVNRLLETGFIEESGEGQASHSGGRKPILIKVKPTHRYIIGIDLSLEHPVCAIGNLNYQLLDKEKVVVAIEASKEERLLALYQAVERLLEKEKTEADKIGCIVISTPGIVRKDGSVYFSNSQHTRWTSIDVVSFMREKYQADIIVRNDVNLALMAEMAIGYGSKYKNLTYISCGTGVGSGIALDRKIYEGENQAAGEIGYFIDAAGSGTTLEEDIKLSTVMAEIKESMKNGQKSLLGDRPNELTFADVVEAYRAEDPFVKQVFYEKGKILGPAIANIVSLLDIGIVIIGGVYTEFYEDLVIGIKEITDKVKLINPQIVKSGFNSNGCIYGAFVTGTDHVIRIYSK